MLGDVDFLVTDVMTGLVHTVRRALSSLAKAEIRLRIAVGDPEGWRAASAQPQPGFHGAGWI
jgi:hypothetical protein